MNSCWKHNKNWIIKLQDNDFFLIGGIRIQKYMPNSFTKKIKMKNSNKIYLPIKYKHIIKI